MIVDEIKDYPPYLDYPKPYKTQTNADRIRAMSDEELVKMIISSEEEFWLLCMLENRRRGNAT